MILCSALHTDMRVTSHFFAQFCHLFALIHVFQTYMIYSLLWNIKEERFGFHWLAFCGDTVQVNGNCSLYPASATEGNVYGCVMTSMWVNHRFLIFGMNWNDDHVFFSAHSYRLISSLEQKMFWRMSAIKPVPIGNLEIQWKSTAARNVCQRFSHQCCFRRKKCI